MVKVKRRQQFQTWHTKLRLPVNTYLEAVGKDEVSWEDKCLERNTNSEDNHEGEESAKSSPETAARWTEEKKI